MPTQPAISGLPVWAQIIISLIIGVATLGVAFKGYFTKSSEKTDASTTAVLGAAIADMGAIRHLSDCTIQLTGVIVALTKAIDEDTHYQRNSIEIARETCQRLRELTEEMERQGRDARRWDSRDEKRRPPG